MLFIIIAFKIKICVSSQALSVERDRRKKKLAFSTAWVERGNVWGEDKGQRRGESKGIRTKYSLYIYL